MSKRLEQFHEDRAIRDAARAVLLADIEHARVSFSAKGVADRVGGRIGDGAKDVLEVAKTQADSNRGIIAALIGAILLWLGRDTILELLGLAEDEDGSQPDTEIEEPSPEVSPPGDDNEQ
ncbi:hypothetical protein [uncultured Erythrobacter sp.]|uniref:hypothetical protein n=1 Tax=uncultured Erythrobacter sp. TaxID=263913 RepID=UPI00260DF377|nr:hypothetical protein [uncultured Erythrobacter sp.]